jgi:hypothetical protein
MGIELCIKLCDDALTATHEERARADVSKVSVL